MQWVYECGLCRVKKLLACNIHFCIFKQYFFNFGVIPFSVNLPVVHSLHKNPQKQHEILQGFTGTVSEITSCIYRVIQPDFVQIPRHSADLDFCNVYMQCTVYVKMIESLVECWWTVGLSKLQ